MHYWEVGGVINIGWPDFGRPERSYTIVNMDHLGQVLRARVTDGEKQGGFLVVHDCPEVVLEMLAEQATNKLGFRTRVQCNCIQLALQHRRDGVAQLRL